VFFLLLRVRATPSTRFLVSLAAQREGVPGKGCALNPHRKLGDAGKDGQLAQFSPVPVRRRLARHQLVELVENSFRSALVLPFTLCVIMDAEALEMAHPEP
jgi:hypothetical protein